MRHTIKAIVPADKNPAGVARVISRKLKDAGFKRCNMDYSFVSEGFCVNTTSRYENTVDITYCANYGWGEKHNAIVKKDADQKIAAAIDLLTKAGYALITATQTK